METKIKMLTIKEAASLIDGITEYRIRQLCIKKEIPHYKAGNKYLINYDILLEYFSCGTPSLDNFKSHDTIKSVIYDNGIPCN